MPGFRVLYICASDRSGSTLLQGLLGLQPDFFSVGEVRRVASLGREGRPCGCGRQIPDCAFWSAVEQRLGRSFAELPTEVEPQGLSHHWSFLADWGSLRLGFPRAADVLLPRQREAARNSHLIYDAIADLAACRVIVDSSKTRSHFVHLWLRHRERMLPIFLVRDGRGVVWSKIRRTGASPAGAIDRWCKVTRLQLALRPYFPAPHSGWVRYEDLCKDPAATLAAIVRPLGAEVKTTRLGEMAAGRHDLGGSPRFAGTVPESIELDEAWRKEMPEELRREFEARAGGLNRAIGYGS